MTKTNLKASRDYIPIIVVFLVLCSIIGGWYVYTQTDYLQNSEDRFTHSYFSGESFSGKITFEEPPSYNEALVTHNSKLPSNTYTFSYSRNYNQSSFTWDMSVNRERKLISYRKKISSNGHSIITEGFYRDNKEYVRATKSGSSSSQWKYRVNETTFEDASKTGFNQLRSFEVSGVAYRYEETIVKNGVTYYKYSPQIVDQEEFESNKFYTDTKPDTVKVYGEVIVSEYGIIVSAKSDYIVGDTTIETRYSLTSLGSLDSNIEEPIWLSAAKSTESTENSESSGSGS